MRNQRLTSDLYLPSMQHAQRVHPDPAHAPGQMLGTVRSHDTTNTRHHVGLSMAQKVRSSRNTLGCEMHIAKIKVL
jgi:hypothetical protein